MCQDILEKRLTEIDMFAGTIMELGEKHGVPTPVNRFLFNAIKALESQY
jgi:2-dehydropantoate 2-reductase